MKFRESDKDDGIFLEKKAKIERKERMGLLTLAKRGTKVLLGIGKKS